MTSRGSLTNARLDPFDRRSHRWGIILAPGEGTTRLPLTSRICDDERPNQFCATTGEKTLLDQTRERLLKIVRPQQTLIVVTRTNSSFCNTFSSESRVVIQPYYRGTAPALAYSLFRLRELDRSAVVGIFPSDHHFLNEARLAATLESLFHAAEIRTDRLMLLGIPPDSPKPAYGWIEPGAPLGAPLPDTVRYVRSFWNKPAAAMASALMKNGCLLNSFLMVGQVDTFWALMQRAMPALTRAFEAIRRAFFTEREEAAVLDLYARIPSTSFSGNVLAKYPDRLAVVCADKLGWKHFAEPGRDLPFLGREESGLLGPEAA